MKLESLQLLDVRNYHQLDLTVGPGSSLFVGPNAQGKTNILEAVHYLGIGRSHRTASDTALIRHGAEAGIIRATARTTDGDEVRVAIELRQGRSRAQVGGGSVPRLRDAYGVIKSVMLAPEDLSLVRGDPAERRRYLDDLLAGRRATFSGAKSDFERSLTQRNAILKEGRRTGRFDNASFEIWNETYVRLAATVLAARIAAVHALAEPTATAYADLVTDSPAQDVDRHPVLTYQISTGRSVCATPGTALPDPQVLKEELSVVLRELHEDERRRGTTLVGPHRDDLHLAIGELPAKGYASHGEQWSFALALKLATHAVIADVGEAPIVLLDDVFSELDEDRRRRLALRCEHFDQVIATSATGTDVPLQGMRYWVQGGTVTGPEPVS